MRIKDLGSFVAFHKNLYVSWFYSFFPLKCFSLKIKFPEIFKIRFYPTLLGQSHWFLCQDIRKALEVRIAGRFLVPLLDSSLSSTFSRHFHQFIFYLLLSMRKSFSSRMVSWSVSNLLFHPFCYFPSFLLFLGWKNNLGIGWFWRPLKRLLEFHGKVRLLSYPHLATSPIQSGH